MTVAGGALLVPCCPQTHPACSHELSEVDAVLASLPASPVPASPVLDGSCLVPVVPKLAQRDMAGVGA